MFNNTLTRYLNLIRVGNLLIVIIFQLLIYYCVLSPSFILVGLMPSMHLYHLGLVSLAIALIMAAGNVINDYFDTHIDEINKPDNVLVGRTIHRRNAMTLHQILTGLGVALGLFVAYSTSSIYIATFFIVVPGVLWFYSSVYKRQFLLGNLLVSILCALTPFLVLWAEQGLIEKNQLIRESIAQAISRATGWVAIFSLFAFITTLIREIVKDIEDIEGDRELECRTVPIVLGIGATKLIVAIISFVFFALVGIFAHKINIISESKLPFYYLIGTVMIPLLLFLFILLKAKEKNEYHYASRVLKYIMVAGTMFTIFVYRIIIEN